MGWQRRIGANPRELPMTSKADRSAISRAVAKAIAYHDCGKPQAAAKWAAEVVRLLEAQAILTPAALASRPEG